MNGYVMLVVSQVMLGSIAVFARWASLPAEVMVFARCLIGMTAIGIAAMFMTSIRQYLRPNRTLALLLGTGLFMSLNWYFFFRAVLTADITSSMLLYNLAPVFVLLSATAFLGEIPTARQAACLAAAVLGMTIILGGNGMGGFTLQAGSLYAILAGALYAQVTVIGRRLKGVPAPVVTFFQTGVGAVLFSVVALPQIHAVGLTHRQVAILLVIGLCNTAIPYLMYFKALQSVKATIAGMAQYIYTLSTIVFSAIFFKEAVGASTVAGGALILAASFIAVRHPGTRALWRKGESHA